MANSFGYGYAKNESKNCAEKCRDRQAFLKQMSGFSRYSNKKTEAWSFGFSAYRRIIFLRKHVQSRNRPFRPYVEILSNHVGQEARQRLSGSVGYRKALHGQFQG